MLLLLLPLPLLLPLLPLLLPLLPLLLPLPLPLPLPSLELHLLKTYRWRKPVECHAPSYD
jgi:hypothetical protein